MNELELITVIDKFPIGSKPNSREELLSKAAIVSFLARFQEQLKAIENIDERELAVRDLLGKALRLKETEVIPNLPRAENILRLSNGFIHDYGKVQFIKENNPDFENAYDMIASSLGLINDISSKTI